MNVFDFFTQRSVNIIHDSLALVHDIAASNSFAFWIKRKRHITENSDLHIYVFHHHAPQYLCTPRKQIEILKELAIKSNQTFGKSSRSTISKIHQIVHVICYIGKLSSPEKKRHQIFKLSQRFP